MYFDKYYYYFILIKFSYIKYVFQLSIQSLKIDLRYGQNISILKTTTISHKIYYDQQLMKYYM